MGNPIRDPLDTLTKKMVQFVAIGHPTSYFRNEWKSDISQNKIAAITVALTYN
jgi:hypothetical protein